MVGHEHDRDRLAGKSLVRVLAEAMELERHGERIPADKRKPPCATCTQYAKAQAKALRALSWVDLQRMLTKDVI